MIKKWLFMTFIGMVVGGMILNSVQMFNGRWVVHPHKVTRTTLATGGEVTEEVLFDHWVANRNYVKSYYMGQLLMFIWKYDRIIMSTFKGVDRPDGMRIEIKRGKFEPLPPPVYPLITTIQSPEIAIAARFYGKFFCHFYYPAVKAATLLVKPSDEKFGWIVTYEEAKELADAVNHNMWRVKFSGINSLWEWYGE